MKRNHDIIEITGMIRHQTEAAMLVDGGDEEPVWLPKSQCQIDEIDKKGCATISLPEWLAKEKGLI